MKHGVNSREFASRFKIHSSRLANEMHFAASHTKKRKKNLLHINCYF